MAAECHERAVVVRDPRPRWEWTPPVNDTALLCAICGMPLNGDPDEDPTGDAGMPICGNCARERDFFVIDVLDGVVDGRLDPDR